MTDRKGNSLSPEPCALIPHPSMVPNPSIVKASTRGRDHGNRRAPAHRDAWMGRSAARFEAAS